MLDEWGTLDEALALDEADMLDEWDRLDEAYALEAPSLVPPPLSNDVELVPWDSLLGVILFSLLTKKEQPDSINDIKAADIKKRFHDFMVLSSIFKFHICKLILESGRKKASPQFYILLVIGTISKKKTNKLHFSKSSEKRKSFCFMSLTVEVE